MDNQCTNKESYSGPEGNTYFHFISWVTSRDLTHPVCTRIWTDTVEIPLTADKSADHIKLHITDNEEGREEADLAAAFPSLFLFVYTTNPKSISSVGQRGKAAELGLFDQ